MKAKITLPSPVFAAASPMARAEDTKIADDSNHSSRRSLLRKLAGAFDEPSRKSAAETGKSRSTIPSMGLVLAVAMTLLSRNASAQTTVELGTAGGFSVLAGSGISNTGPTTIIGNVGLSPTTGAAITGFPPALVTGTVYAVNAFGPAGSINNPGLLIIAKNDLNAAYLDAAGRPANVTFVPVYDLGGQTLVGGVYRTPSSFGITGTLTLNAAGNPNTVWIFQAGSTLITASNSRVILINGAQACMVFWQVGSSATLGTNSTIVGTVMAQTSISALTGAKVNGRLLALNGAVTLDSNSIMVSLCIVGDTGGTGGIGVTGDNGTIVIVQNPLEDVLTGITLTPGQTSLAGALDRVLSDKRQFDVLTYLDSQDINALPHLLDLIAPEELTSIFTLGRVQFDTEVFSVQQRLADIRATPASEEAPIPQRVGKEIVPMGDGKSVVPKGDGKSVLSMGNDTARSRMPTKDRWGFFVTETGDFTSLGDTSNANGFDLKSYGTTVGVDRLIGEHFVLGLTLGYNHSDVDLSGGGRLNSDGAKVALYAMYHDGGFWMEGLIGGGVNSYDSRRTALNGTAHGSTNGTQLDAHYGLGYDVKLGGFTVTPMASMLFTSVGIDSFDERGSLQPLHIESQTESSLRSRVGVRVAYTAKVGAARVTPSIGAQWQHEFLDNELSLDSRFANGAGGVFSVPGPKVGRDSALVTGAVNVAWSRYSAYVACQADLSRTNYESQTVLAGLRVSF